MLRIDARKPVHFCDGLTRRDFLHAGSLGVLGLGLPAMNALEARGAIKSDREMNCIFCSWSAVPPRLIRGTPSPIHRPRSGDRSDRLPPGRRVFRSRKFFLVWRP